METLIAPSALFAILALFVVAMLSTRQGSLHRSGTWLFLFATAVVTLIAGMAFMTNWLAFIDPPDYCWKSRDRITGLTARALSWEDCRVQITLTALSLDAVIACAMLMSLTTIRRR